MYVTYLSFTQYWNVVEERLPLMLVNGNVRLRSVKVLRTKMWKLFIAHIFVKRGLICIKPTLKWSIPELHAMSIHRR